MTITAIKPYIKGKNRFAVYLNDEFAFVLYKGELSKYGLFEGGEISDGLYNRIIDETLLKRAKLRGMNLLQKMDRTEADMCNKLSSSGYPEEVVEMAIDYLKSFHYIDDGRYASDYIRFKSSSMSVSEIKRKLSEKGISEDVMEQQLADFSEDSGEDISDRELELAKKLMIKKCTKLRPLYGEAADSPQEGLEYEEKMKLFSYLYRKGFSMDTIERAYKDLT